MPIKNTWGAKKVRGQEEAALVGLHATKMFDITKGQEVWDMHSSPQYQLPHSCLCTGISQLRLALSLGHLLYHTLFTQQKVAK